MKEEHSMSSAIINRLSRYRRVLDELIQMNVITISSNELGGLTGYSSSQIRQDLSNFGTFGRSGYGYNVNSLYQQIVQILGLDRKYEIIIVGAGHLGQAIANFTQFHKTGFNITAIFDINPRLIGMRINNIEVIDYSLLDGYLRENCIDIGIITTNNEAAQRVAEKLVDGGVKSIWNFATTDIIAPDSMPISNVHLNDSLYLLAYNINLGLKGSRL